MSTRRRTPGVYSSPAPKNEKGERLCRNCKEPLPKGRRHNCSEKCSEEWVIKTSPAYMRRAVWGRDHGVCTMCGTDTDAQKNTWKSLRGEEQKAFARKCGIPAGRAWTDWWDADHIKPVTEDGGECGLENLRTLCIPCHQKVTAELAARTAQKRRDAKALERDSSGLFADQL